MGAKTKIAVATGAALLLAAGVIFYFHPPPRSGIHRGPRTPELFGVGLALRADPRTQGFVIQQVVSNSPAAAAGITSGSWVSKVDDVPVDGKSLAECVNLIRGPAGSSVRLELVASDRSQTNTVELTRQKLKM